MTELKAGRELDALVAERVMGLPALSKKILPKLGRHLFTGDGTACTVCGIPDIRDDRLGMCLHQYSTDIAAAWEVVEKLREKHWLFTLACHHGEWSVLLDLQSPGEEVIAPTAPLAICLAALRAIEHK